jgi:hypothetical protein
MRCLHYSVAFVRVEYGSILAFLDDLHMQNIILDMWSDHVYLLSRLRGSKLFGLKKVELGSSPFQSRGSNLLCIHNCVLLHAGPTSEPQRKVSRTGFRSWPGANMPVDEVAERNLWKRHVASKPVSLAPSAAS